MDDIVRQTSLKHIFAGIVAIQMYWFMQYMAGDIWGTHMSQLHESVT